MSDFRRFWDLGYHRLVPIVPPGADISERSTLHKRVGTKQDGRGKTPGTRGRDGKWSSFDWAAYEADEDDLERWAAMGASVGIKTGQGLYAIDADTMNWDFAVIIRDEVEACFGRLPVRVGQAPKALYLLRVDGELPYTRIDFEAVNETGKLERVEILSEGKQFVAEGVHPKTGQPYTWPRGLTAYEDVPVATPADVTALLEALRAKLPAASKVITEGAGNDVSQASLTGPIDAVRAAVQSTPNSSNHFPSRESYRDYGYAIKAALPEDPDAAFDIWAEWCGRWQQGTNDPDVMAADWARMRPPFRRGASWLYELAETYGSFDRATVHFQPIEDVSPNPFQEISVREATAPKKTLSFTSLQDAAATALEASAKPLVKGLLDQGTLSVMYGPSNVGKTFVAMDVFFHISTGMPWGGLKTTRGLVVYVAAEGGAGARKRADALCRRYGVASASADFQMLLISVDLLRADADLEPLIAAIRGLGRPALAIGLDTLSRIMAGGEENSSVDMGTLVKHVDRIRHETGAHVMLVHHSGKDHARGARGHSLLRAATDTEIEIGDGEIAVTKQRDLDKTYVTAFRLDVVQLGVDPDGDAVTSCTVELVPRLEVPKSPLTPKEETVMQALLALTDDAPKGVRVSDLGKFLREGGADDMSDNAVRMHLKSMAKKHTVVCPSRGFWAPEVVETRSPLHFFDRQDTDKVVESGGRSGGNIFE